MATVGIPGFSDTVRQNFLLEPLGGPRDTFYYLHRFPEEIYNKSPDTHLYKFMRALLGENGVNWIKKNHFEARVGLEELGVDMFDLDAYYGSPFGFGRILEEEFEDDPFSLIDKTQWEQIKAKNARYRNRALDYMNGARAGNTPLGMRLAAKSGLGHDVEIIENYKYLFDVHSDDPLGLTYYGKTLSTEEMIVLPRREVGSSEIQQVYIYGEPNAPNTGSFYFLYNGIYSNLYTYEYDDGGGIDVLNTIPWNGTRDHVRLALEAIPEIGPGNVDVQGGPGPNLPWAITFTGQLAARDVPELQIIHNLSYSGDLDQPIVAKVVTLYGGREAIDEVVNIPPKDEYTLQSAVDRIRAQTTIMTLGESRGLRERNNWNVAAATSEYTEVVRYVTGASFVKWPAPDPARTYLWIESAVEKEAPRVYNDLQYHYMGWHNIASVESSSNFLSTASTITPDQALADYAEPLHVTSATENPAGQAASFVNGIYPTEYQDLPGVPPVRYAAEQYWSSLARAGDEYLTILLPFVSCINYVSMDINRDPVQVDIDYDLRDQGEDAVWTPVTPVEPYSNVLTPSLDQMAATWASVGLTFTQGNGGLIWTRAIKIKLSRIGTYTGTIKIRNLRVGRNV